MTKLVFHITKIVIAAVVALLFGSCNANISLGNKITGSGNVTKEVRNLSGFSKILVYKGLDCEVQQSDKFAVIVEADDNLHEGIITTVENGLLKIDSQYNGYKNVSSKKIIVQMPVIEVLEATGGSSLKSLNTLNGENMTVKTSSGSDMDVTVESDTITCESSSGSELTIKGKAIKAYAHSSSGSSIKAGNLMANEIDAQSTSGSSITVAPILLLDAKASSGSSISYTKVPKQIRKESSSGGNVSEE
ncbi:MAG TPA: head GIN domain-containing protein [Flavobacterium sp.]|uniref:head GIN domain-containing protein n=1 Tax=Flavobacterium sp. TaxID=239 RepID=UPI002B614B74|nr:head GIN domain-containing protein [Flavobacterium sp.]HSD15523.1 head GIN domain-containing protein [Flavobacterium sp.]